MQNRYVGKNHDWEAELKAAQDELSFHGHEMSDYERNVISREIKKRQEELIPIVGGKVIGEYKQSIEAYKAAEQAEQAERTKEINRFDSVKYNAELQAISSRVNMTAQHTANPMTKEKRASERLKEIYNEAFQSGDIHKQRAAIEVLKNIPLSGDSDERMRINQLSKDAEAAEAKLRQTEGLVKAQEAKQKALSVLDARHERLNEVSKALGQGDVTSGNAYNSFSKAWKQAQRLPTGEIKFYKETDPEVTGVYWNK